MNAPFKHISPDAAAAVQRDGGLAPPLEKRRLLLYGFQILLDAALVLGAFALGASAYTGDLMDHRTLLVAETLLLLYLVFAMFNATYSLSSLTNWQASSGRMILALVLSAGLLSFVAFYTKSSANFSRGTFTLGIIFSFVLMFVARVVFTYLVRRKFGPSMTNELVINDGGPPLQLAYAYHVSAAEHGLSASLSDPYSLDRLGNYLRHMDRVIVSCMPESRGEWSLVLKGSGVSGEVVSSFAHDIGVIGVRHFDGSGLASLVISTGPLGIRARAAKRLFDLVISGLVLLVLAPVLVLVTLAIILEDGGSAVFRQRRLGRGNRFFTMHKFRTMAAEKSDPDGRKSAIRGDDRVTRVGRFLRATSIDELPQLINVLFGNMSLVGPRPHAIGSQAGDKFFWDVDRRYWQRHSLKPGLTGLAQVRGHRGATHEESDLTLRLQSDLEYLNGWSIWRDIHIIVLTLRVLVHDKAF